LQLTIGFSPCPNDTFIFDALVNKKIDTGSLTFEPVMEDVETLNQWALTGKLDITKISFPAFFQSSDKYALLNSGSALGKGVGPLLISNHATPKPEPETCSIALPGAHTTANLLFSFAYPRAFNKKFMIFSAIEDAVLNGETDLGVIIHENRFTYQQKGLHKVMDLGEYWEQKMKVPIPLGGIVIQRTLGESVCLQVDKLIRRSLQHAYKHYPQVTDYVKQHSQTMSEEVMRQHIDLYVNNYSLDLGDDGRHAVIELQKVFAAQQTGNGPSSNQLFLS